MRKWGWPCIFISRGRNEFGRNRTQQTAFRRGLYQLNAIISSGGFRPRGRIPGSCNTCAASPGVFHCPRSSASIYRRGFAEAMRGTISLEDSQKRYGRRVALKPKQGAFLKVAAGMTILSGLFFTNAPLARAAEDQAKISIAPMPRRPSEPTSRAGSIRIDVNLVQIPVMVTDPYERPVLGLKKTDFHVFEDGVEREISQFISEEAPISVGIVFDSSASMRPKMDQSIQAVREFLKMSLPGDEFFLTKFSDKPESVLGFTTQSKDIEDGMARIQPAGWTALFDAISLGIHQMKRASLSRRVLLVMSDGGDNDSRYTEREVRELVKEADVRIFSISIL